MNPEDLAAEVARRILLGLFAGQLANESGVERGSDPESLHDYRVAVRRTRTALGQFRRALPTASLKQFRDEFSWIARSTGKARDLDVFLVEWEEYTRGLGTPLEVGAELIRCGLDRQSSEIREELRGLLGSERYEVFRTEWREYLTAEWRTSDLGPDGSRQVGDVATERIGRAWWRVSKWGGAALEAGSRAHTFHRLRIACKRLRYLLEFFESLAGRTRVEPLVGSLKQLQDCLGDHNDRVVHQKILTEMIQDDTEDLPVGLGLACRLLRQHLASLEEEERSRSLPLIRGFLSLDLETRIQTLFATR